MSVRAYVVDAKFETLAALRTPGFAIPFIAVPVAIYLLFGVVIAGNAGATSELGPGVANYLLCGFMVLAVAMPGVFTGVILATDREGRLLDLKRALPLPTGATVVSKVLMAMGISTLAVSLIVIAALLAGKSTLSAGQVAVMAAVLIPGSIPFCAIGLLIGTMSSASAAPAWGNLVFLPMMWLSGLFIPLPDSLEQWVIVWPTFHLNQVALAAAGVTEFVFIPPAMAAAVLVGVTVICGGLAIRRLGLG